MTETSNAQLGKIMLVWALILGLGVWFLQEWLDQKYQPNAGLVTTQNEPLRLAPDPYHQYSVDGAINHHQVTFLIDTGASSVSVPAAVAKKAGLVGGEKYWVTTANGSIQVESTRIEKLMVGGFELRNIEAGINPHMDDGIILLGMSAMRHLRFSQDGDTMVIEQPSQ